MTTMEEAASLAFENKEAIGKAEQVGCYFCLRAFPAIEVDEWTDDEATALCPHCGVDAILPGITDIEFLTAAHVHWFCM